MPFNFIDCDRDQELLLPPSMREWLSEDHLAWFILDAVDEIDLDSFYVAYRQDGWGRAAHDPQMMVSLLLYAYCLGERSSRKIERRCHEDIAFRVITANSAPDHATIARFRTRHQQALADVFTGVLRLCAEAGLASVGLLALDSTKVAANASRDATRTYESIAYEVEEMLEEAKAKDAEEDRQLGKARGDELPEDLRHRDKRKQRLKQCKTRLEAAHRQREVAYEDRMQERQAQEQREGRIMPGRKPKAPSSSELKHKKVNTTDPDSRLCKSPSGFVQGYNAQAVANEHHLVVCAELVEDVIDQQQLDPMVAATEKQLVEAGVDDQIGTVLADAGYCSNRQIEAVKGRDVEVMVAIKTAASGKRRAQSTGELPGPQTPRTGSERERMEAVLASERGKSLYRRRKALIEPIFGDLKFNRSCDRFQRRGRDACQSEWRLMAATHNLLKLWRHRSSLHQHPCKPEMTN